MISTLPLTTDQFSFFLENKRFFPSILERWLGEEIDSSFNAVLIHLDAGVQSNLDWSCEIRRGEKAILQGKYILWHLDFGLSKEQVFLHDLAIFSSFLIAIREFTAKVWNRFADHTFGVVLYQGTVLYDQHLLWDRQQKEDFEASLYYNRLTEKKERLLFSLEILSAYLHRLAPHFPEEVFLFANFDTSLVEQSSILAYLLSKEHFPHVYLGIKNAKAPLGILRWEEGVTRGGFLGSKPFKEYEKREVKVGIVLPLLSLIEERLLEKIEKIFTQLNEQKVFYRIIEEPFLTESWDGLDTLLVFPEQLSSHGKRKLQGFIAAGGKVLAAEEIDRGRGI